MNKITETLLRIVSEYDGDFKGAFNIREDGGCAGRQSTENVKIESKQDSRLPFRPVSQEGRLMIWCTMTFTSVKVQM